MQKLIKIYFWQVISLISGFATMFMVTPYLASNQNYFGIYTFVISLNLFLSYADFGFLSAGVKFASEAYARNDRNEEMNVLGFVFFILCIVFSLFGLLILFFSFNPQYVLKGLSKAEDLKLAEDLFLVFFLSLPVLIAQRGLQIIFNIRLYDYLYQRVFSLLNLVKISSVFYFFRGGEYHIVQFYLFTQIITLLSIVIGCMIAKKRFKYEFFILIKAVKFSLPIYRKTKNLAFNSLFVTISWIIYYELDSLIIGKFVGLKEVAIFNICMSVMMLSRSLYGILYNPFTAKFNHYIGKDEKDKLGVAYEKILIIGLPLSVIPTTILILTMKNFIFSWVGIEYSSAIPIIAIMFASYYYTFISNPTGIAMVALENIKSLYWSSALLPVIYWLGIILTFHSLGLWSFGFFKFVAFTISAVLYFYYGKKMFSLNWMIFFKRNIIPALLTVVIIFLINLACKSFLPETKGKNELFIYVGMMIGYGLASLSFYYYLSKDFQRVSKEIFGGLFKSSLLKV